MEAIQLEYTCLLTSQLEKQRIYFENKLAEAERRFGKLEKMAQAQVSLALFHKCSVDVGSTAAFNNSRVQIHSMGLLCYYAKSGVDVLRENLSIEDNVFLHINCS